MRLAYIFICLSLTTNLLAQSRGWSVEPRIVMGKSWRNEHHAGAFHLFYQTGANFVRHYRIVSFGAGLAFSSEGNSYRLPMAQENTVDRVNFLRIPVFARFQFSNESKFSPFAVIGQAFGFYLSGREPINKFDDGFFTNLGVMTKLSDKSGVTLCGTYYHGIAQQKALTGGDNKPVIANRNIGIGFGLQYSLSGN